MRFLLATITMLLLTINLRAQRLSPELPHGATFARFNPLGLADAYDMNISFGTERRMGMQWSAALDAAYIFHTERYKKAKGTSGFILRPALRYYPGARRFYLEAEFHYKNVTYKFEDWLGREVVNDVPSYEEYTRFRERKIVMGPQLKLGRIMTISRNRKFWMDAYLGVGLRFKKFKVVGRPASTYEYRNDTNELPIDEERYLALPLGVRFMYRIR